jgi:hypothetical protein
MKTRLHFLFIALALLASLTCVNAQGTAFTYQGRLNAGGTPTTGLYDFRFRLAADSLGNTYVGSPYSTNAVPTTNGLFVTTIDFGPGIFIGTTNWLEVDVRTNGAGGYTILSPLQNVTPTPYAVFAETANNVSGTLSNVTVGGSLTLPATGSTIFAGSSLLLYGDNNYNFFSGVNAGSRPASGAYNTGFGDQALENNTGTENTAVGFTALFSNTGGGNNNTAIGSQALTGNGAGNNNTAEGELALNTSTGSFNTANGANALLDNLGGNYNTASGATALQNNRGGNYNTASGYQSLYSGFGNPNGSYNTADGYQALYSHSTGNYNIALGAGAGYALTTGSSNIDIGNPGVTGDANLIRIGTSQTQTYLAGVINGNGGGLTNLNAGQLNGSFPASQLSGTLSLAQIPAGVVTNGEPLVSLGALFVSALTMTGSLNLPSPATITSGFQTVMYFDANQNLGLGGATPQQTLSLNGGMNLDQSGQNTGTTANALTFGSNGGSTSGEGIGSVRSSGSPDSFGLNFYTDFAKRLTIVKTGKVGIATTAPAAQLDVTDSSGSGTAVNGNTTSGTGVQGASTTGNGLAGNSVSGTGVQASSATGAALNIASGALKVQGAGVNTGTTAFIQVATAADVYTVTYGTLLNGYQVVTNGTIINNPICDGNSNAILIITHNISASSSTDGINFGDPTGVGYDPSTSHWVIFNQNTGDHGTMPLGTAFNVLVIVP